MQSLHENHAVVAAKAQQQAAARVKVLAVSCHQEDEAHTQAFTSAAATRSCQVAAIHAALPQYERSWDKYVTWLAEYDTQKKES